MKSPVQKMVNTSLLEGFSIKAHGRDDYQTVLKKLPINCRSALPLLFLAKKYSLRVTLPLTLFKQALMPGFQIETVLVAPGDDLPIKRRMYMRLLAAIDNMNHTPLLNCLEEETGFGRTILK